ncbi:Metallo-dependent phosphatase [Colletotrichum somersetense]|nr:Metallo-dependent phosphatase [Colletotrichum somersetense]
MMSNMITSPSQQLGQVAVSRYGKLCPSRYKSVVPLLKHSVHAWLCYRHILLGTISVSYVQIATSPCPRDSPRSGRDYESQLTSAPTRHLFLETFSGAMTVGESLIKTRIFVISDTHGLRLRYKHQADVVIHCGDLTNESELEEYRNLIKDLSSVKAPLKLVVPGNHDFTLDIPRFKRRAVEVQHGNPEVKKKYTEKYGNPGDARGLFEEARDAGIVLLEEGTYVFKLANGARLKVYASPHTPAAGGFPGFQYQPEDRHDFAIEKGTDIAVTHGPALGMLDHTKFNPKAGSPELFDAIARARPQLHCCGHIHESWGAKMVTWNENPAEEPTGTGEDDLRESAVIATLRDFKSLPTDSTEETARKRQFVKQSSLARCCEVSLCQDHRHPLEFKSRTLFVNAAIQGAPGEAALHYPWMIDIDLPKAC